MRGPEGEMNVSNADPFEVVRNFLEKLGDRDPTSEEVERIRPSLEALYAKLARIQKLSPTLRRVDLSEPIWSLMKRIGKRRIGGPRRPFGRAAIF